MSEWNVICGGSGVCSGVGYVEWSEVCVLECINGRDK